MNLIHLEYRIAHQPVFLIELIKQSCPEDKSTLKLRHSNNTQVVKKLQDYQKPHLHNSLKSNIVGYSRFCFCFPLTGQTVKEVSGKTEKRFKH